MTEASKDPFVIDVQALRKRARESMDQGAVTSNYGGDVETTVKLLNDALATELVCWLRYTFHAITAQGLSSEAVKAEFAEHAREELEHAQQLAERINQLNGKPNMNPEGLATRSHSQYVEGTSLVDMIRENLIAERIAIESYREMVRYFGEKDPVTRRMLEEILAKEEEHADDMNDLLASHDPEPKKP
jgi:bacterioferritin